MEGAMLKDCKHCGIEFNTDTARKRQVGGRVNECPDCVEEMGTETAVPYAGVMAGDGKGVGVTVLAFNSQKDREAYVKAWRSNSGQNVGKSCQLSGSNTYMGNMKFRKVGESGSIGTNHKGRM
jgi:hypothetical protein